MERIEKLAKIKFKQIGPPQPLDIMKRNANDIVISLKKVEDEALEAFIEIAEEMIK